MHADHWQIPPRRELFEPWDTTRLEHLSNMMPELLNLPTLQHEGKQFGIPADWGINSICYRSDLVNIEEESWASLWDRSREGRIAMTAQMNDAVLAAALALGIPNPFVSDPQIMSAIETKLREQRHSCASTGPIRPSCRRPWRRAKWKSRSPGRPFTRS
jgi:spermidine/putrescine transport system substrate-binding protein